MKVICPISGMPLLKTDYLLGLVLSDEHPIFRAKSQLIFHKDMIHRFVDDNCTREEKHLIFLAFLYHSTLVDFEHTALPSLATMERNFERLTTVSQWVAFAKYQLKGIISFPRYIVRKENMDLNNIGSWIAAIDDIRTKVYKDDKLHDKSASLLAKENEIKKELTDANFYGKAFTAKLARWALDVCEVSPNNPEYPKWMKLLATPLDEAWLVDEIELKNLITLFECELPMLDSNPQAIAVMHQIRLIKTALDKGFQQYDLFSDDSKDGVIKDFEIVEEDEDGIERKHLINQHLKDIPEIEPNQKDFPGNKIGYLCAKARWDLSQARIARQNEGGKHATN